MTIYDILVNSAENGIGYTINLKEKYLKVGREVLIENGKYEGDLIGDLPKDALEMFEELFSNYYHSIPSNRSKRRKQYFDAKEGIRNKEKLTVAELTFSESRLSAQAKLEGFVLCASLAGILKWNPAWGNWFWKSTKYPKLVLLKEWL